MNAIELEYLSLFLSTLNKNLEDISSTINNTEDKDIKLHFKYLLYAYNNLCEIAIKELYSENDLQFVDRKEMIKLLQKSINI